MLQQFHCVQMIRDQLTHNVHNNVIKKIILSWSVDDISIADQWYIYNDENK